MDYVHKCKKTCLTHSYTNWISLTAAYWFLQHCHRVIPRYFFFVVSHTYFTLPLSAYKQKYRFLFLPWSWFGHHYFIGLEHWQMRFKTSRMGKAVGFLLRKIPHKGTKKATACKIQCRLNDIKSNWKQRTQFCRIPLICSDLLGICWPNSVFTFPKYLLFGNETNISNATAWQPFL